jgi:hypothetical protein
VVENGKSQVLVNGGLYGAGRVPNRDSRGGHAMQGIHAKNHLLEASWRHHPHQHTIDTGELETPSPDRPFSSIHKGRHLRKWHCVKLDTKSLRRAGEIGHMPSQS